MARIALHPTLHPNGLFARYRWHRANPAGANEVGKAAEIALDRAKAELWANETEVMVEWVREDGEYTAIAYNAERKVVAAIGGFEEGQVGDRATEAMVLADARANGIPFADVTT